MSFAASRSGTCPHCQGQVHLTSFVSIRLPDDLDLWLRAQVVTCKQCHVAERRTAFFQEPGDVLLGEEPRTPPATSKDGECPSCAKGFALPPRPWSTENEPLIGKSGKEEWETIHRCLAEVDGARYPTCPACGFPCEYDAFVTGAPPIHPGLRVAHSFLKDDGAAIAAIEAIGQYLRTAPNAPVSPLEPVRRLLAWWIAARAPSGYQSPLDPKAADGHRVLAKQHVARGDAASAIPELSRAIERDPRKIVLRIERGEALLLALDFAGALQDFEEARQAQPGFQSDERIKSVLQKWMGAVQGSKDLNASAALYQQAKIGGFERTLHEPMARLLSEFIRSFLPTAAAGGDVSQVYVAEGAKHLRAGRLEEAVHSFDIAIKSNPSSAEHVSIRAQIRWGTGDRAGAMEDLRKAVDVAPPHWAHRARIEEDLKKIAGAKSDPIRDLMERTDATEKLCRRALVDCNGDLKEAESVVALLERYEDEGLTEDERQREFRRRREAAARRGESKAADDIRAGIFGVVTIGLMPHPRVVCLKCGRLYRRSEGISGLLGRLVQCWCFSRRIDVRSLGCVADDRSLGYCQAYNARVVEHIRTRISPRFEWKSP
jgi:tetratricopeptide (TPR) repeat protein